MRCNASGRTGKRVELVSSPQMLVSVALQKDSSPLVSVRICLFLCEYECECDRVPSNPCLVAVS